MTQVTIVGRLAADAETRFTPQGVAVTTLRLVWNDRRKTASGEWEDGDAHFLDATAWRQLGESCSELTKGQRVVVVGELKSRQWEQDGHKRTAWQVEAVEVGVLLDRFGSRAQQGAGWSKDARPTSLHDPWAAQAADNTPPF